MSGLEGGSAEAGLTAPVRVTVEGLDDAAQEVQDWLRGYYEHTAALCEPAREGALRIELSVPRGSYPELASWTARMLEVTGSIDVALEILASCFEDLALAPQAVLDVHLVGD